MGEHGRNTAKPIYADIAIIGAGASGLMAACFAAVSPFKVVAIERNGAAGKKLSITGKGRCNIANSADLQATMRNIPGNGKFMYSAFHAMPAAGVIAFFEGLGVKAALERGGRYFTQSGDARDVTRALCGRAASAGAEILCGARVESIEVAGGGVAGGEAGSATGGEDAAGGEPYFLLRLGGGEGAGAGNRGGEGAGGRGGADAGNRGGAGGRSGAAGPAGLVRARRVIIATGGLSYPRTGSTGDGYRLAAALGHAIVPPQPSLVPLETAEEWPRGLSGLTLRNVGLKLFDQRGGQRFKALGEMLFTHFGISGPMVLSGSRQLLGCGFAGCAARIDLKPGLTREKLRDRIARDFDMYRKKRLRGALCDLMPRALIPVAIASAGMDAEAPVAAIGKSGVNALADAVKALPLTISGARPIDEAIVTAGGVRTPEINPSTMESKIRRGLYFCGEVIDVDAYTGGFNLSIAFSTGCLAGRSAAASLAAKPPP
ncbi:MAG: NAD(P)/FAD-dependent oxidoreductase [Clostridiales bacterium]|jgi:predicted flavoprotein YhiN|nr:NAD(P)/FAD-dependent oxidoreductase [Clostridiales bacterium]